MVVVHVLILLAGLALIAASLQSAIRTLVVPRSTPDGISSLVFRIMRRIFDLRLKRVTSYEERDRVMAFFAPVTVLLLLPAWLILILVGYMAMYWALGEPLRAAFTLSGSALLTLGFTEVIDGWTTVLSFTEAAIGLIMVALLIAYLPTMYNAFSRREATVTLLEVRAGSPPSAVEMLSRFKRLNRMDRLGDLWTAWEQWFAEIEESHTSLAALSFFRSPQAERSWITAAGAVLDTAALLCSTVDVPRDVAAELCIRAGYIALRRICDFFGITYTAQPQPDDPISIRREEYDAVCQQLVEAGIALKPDAEQSWRNFQGWRVNYDTPLLALAALTMAPYAPWISDRSLRRPPRRFLHKQ